MSHLLDVLVTWTPYLAVGFVLNIVISLAAMVLGTVVGAALAVARISGLRWLAPGARVMTEASRNIPTFVCLFYLAFLVPAELSIAGGLTLPVPGWIKASLALAVAVVGYVSDVLTAALIDLRRGRPEGMLLFLPNWMTYFFIIVMASSTASVIGVNEIVSRANTVISATGQPELMVWIYLYAMAWFLVFCWPLTLLMRRVQLYIRNRLTRMPATQAVLEAPAKAR